MSTGRTEPAEPSPGDLLILVHGTYAARESGDGDNWWQNGGSLCVELKSCFLDAVHLPEGHEVFRWSGENSERARIKAGRELLARLESIEAKGQGYHLVGHSHGGSVIWHTLQLATSQRKSLEHLRSWATVGTPFMHHRTRGFLTAVNVFNLLLAVVLIKPALTAVRGVAQLLAAALSGAESHLVSQAATTPVVLSFWNTPVLRTAEILGVHISTGGNRIQIGGFDSASDQILGNFLLTSPQGWLLLSLAILVVYVYLNLAGIFLGPVLETLHYRNERNLQYATMRRYALRWLGIWSRDDEAIHGLRATLSLSVSFVSKMAPRERLLLSDNLSLLSRPYYWVLSPIFNRFLRPLLDNIVRSFVVKTAQGNNRQGAEVTEVSFTPIAPAAPAEWQPLPQWLDNKIVATANSYASDIAPKLRRIIAAPSFSSALEALENTFSGRELVHTSYFDHPEILDLLAMHLRRAQGGPAWHGNRKTRYPELVVWLDAFYEANRHASGERSTPLDRRPTTRLPGRRQVGVTRMPEPKPPQQDAA